jgi:hypothetical protein
MAVGPEICLPSLIAELPATQVQEASVSDEKSAEMSEVVLPQDIPMVESNVNVATPDPTSDRRRKQDLSRNVPQGSDTDCAVASASESDVAPF